MASKRMFAMTITDSDAFLDLPLSAQALYFHLGMRADDDGFINSPKRIQRMIAASEEDLSLLIEKGFIIQFESGVVVIKHWKINNNISKDRYKETVYKEERALLQTKDNKAYTLNTNCIQNVYSPNTDCIQNVNKTGSQYRLDKNSIDKNSIYTASEEASPAPKVKKHKFGKYKHVLLSDEDIEKLKQDIGEEMTNKTVVFLDEYIEMKGYKAKNHYLAIKKWVIDAVKEQDQKKRRTSEPINKKAQELDQFYEMAAEWAEGGET